MNKVLVNRPWGNFVRFTHNESSTVKIITVEPGQSLSLQYHEHRSEFWKVLKGNPKLKIGDQQFDAVVGDEFEVKEKVPHQIAAQDTQVMILEISKGEFDEDDIVRLEDRYGRV